VLLPAGEDEKVQQLRDSISQQDMVQQLSSSMQELLSTVRAQQEALQHQQAEIQQLRQTVTDLQQQQEQQEQQTSGQQLTWSSSVRPFDAQKAALLDRRAHGLFDARFHSTSRCAVLCCAVLRMLLH